jgi:hypothetical protein
VPTTLDYLKSVHHDGLKAIEHRALSSLSLGKSLPLWYATLLPCPEQGEASRARGTFQPSQQDNGPDFNTPDH